MILSYKNIAEINEMLSYMACSTSYHPQYQEVAEPEDEPLIPRDASERITSDSLSSRNQANREQQAQITDTDTSSRNDSSRLESSSMLEFEIHDGSNNHPEDHYPDPIPV